LAIHPKKKAAIYGITVLSTNSYKTETWVRPKELVENMIKKIKDEIAAFDAKYSDGTPPIMYSPFNGNPEAHETNCMEWAIDTVAIANIHFRVLRDSRDFLDLPVFRVGNQEKREKIALGKAIGGVVVGLLGASFHERQGLQILASSVAEVVVLTNQVIARRNQNEHIA